MMMDYLRKYRQASGAIKAFVWTVISLAALLIVTTIWAYARLEYARTNIPSVPLRESLPSQPKTL